MERVTLSFPALKGATPINDASGLKLNITTLEGLYAAEARNIASAMLKYLAGKPSTRSAPFDDIWAMKLHREMFGHVWKWAGQIRSDTCNIGVPPHRIREELRTLMTDLQHWKDTDMPLLEQAVKLHHRAVWIHPFINGNGRWARLLGNIWLKRNGGNPTLWPADMNRESSIRMQYIAAIKEADNHNLVPLLQLHRTYTAL